MATRKNARSPEPCQIAKDFWLLYVAASPHVLMQVTGNTKKECSTRSNSIIRAIKAVN